jgi:hypothetical protein
MSIIMSLGGVERIVLHERIVLNPQRIVLHATVCVLCCALPSCKTEAISCWQERAGKSTSVYLFTVQT